MIETPVIENREHETNENCWCNPTLEYSDAQTGDQVWSHNEDSLTARSLKMFVCQKMTDKH